MITTVATLRTAMLDALANPGSFLLQVGFMVANDATWLIFWTLFFNRVGQLRGWTRDDLFVLFAVTTTVVGIALGLLSNCRWIGQLAADGALDETLMLPVAPLPHLLASRIDVAALGDLVFGVTLFLFAGHPSPPRAAAFLFAVVCGATVLTSFMVLSGTLTFFFGGRGDQSDLGLNAIVTLASYPLDIFGGVTKVILFTILPAAFVTGLPASLLRHFDPDTGLLLVVVSAGLAVFTWGLFTLGLRRYSSGSMWSRG